TAGKVERKAVEAYVGPVPVRDGIDRPVWQLIRATQTSVAEMAVIPVQDLLELGSEARMNTPAVAAGNWSWRVPEKSWTPELSKRLAEIVDVTDRENDPLEPPEAKSASE
ncbi:MAG: 4-alpha-glucanotransferase, partial [Terracidiphilus sp.]